MLVVFTVLVAAELIVFAVCLAGCKDRPLPDPMAQGRCTVDRYTGGQQSGHACEYQGYLWYCTPDEITPVWVCSRGPELSAETAR